MTANKPLKCKLVTEHNSKTWYALFYTFNVIFFGADDKASVGCVFETENILGFPTVVSPADSNDSPLWSVNFACVVGPTLGAKCDVAIFGHGAISRTVLVDQARRMKEFEDER